MNKIRQTEKIGGFAVHLFFDIGIFVKNRYPLILLIIIGAFAASAVNYFELATSQTIASYDMSDFEVGQIAFETIVAPRSIPADEVNPIFIEEGEKIIRRGYLITEDAYAKLQKMAQSPVYMDYREFADSELYLLLLITLWCMLFAFASFGRRISLRELIFQTFCFIVVYAASTFGAKLPFPRDYPPYTLTLIAPAALFVLIEAVLFGQLSTIFFSFLLSFGVFEACSFEIVPFLFTLASCLAATRIVRKIERRLDMIFVSIILAFVNIAIIVILGVVFKEGFIQMPWIICAVAMNGMLSGILALGLITPVEYLLNTASVFRLMDLSDLNSSIMRKMCVVASGTYQHSQMVAQLAENACRDIGANFLLARVGAYYHDMGKMDQSEYFVENQTNGVNKHNDMKPSLSVSVIRSHVRKGVEKARRLHFPRKVIDIIEEHHGNGLITYFYEEAKKLDPNVNPADFSYYGKPPSSRESAVVMLADTVEAACRTLDNPTEERLDKFIQTLTNAKIDHHQLDNCNLTFRDITKIKAAFVKLLLGYYHNRIEYPDQKDPSANAKAEEQAADSKTPAAKRTRAKKEAVLGDKTLEEVRIHG